MNFDDLKNDFYYYLENKSRFISDNKYYGKFIVIKNKEVLGVYTTEELAIKDMISKNYKIGEFIIQVVLENDGTKANFVSNVYV